jgi:hypothetical protein
LVASSLFAASEFPWPLMQLRIEHEKIIKNRTIEKKRA